MGKTSQDDEVFKAEGEALSLDAGLQIVGGWFSVFKVDGETVVDTDNEEIDVESYRQAFVDFSKEYREANFEHRGGERGTLIDNILIDSVDFAKMLVHEITGLPLDEIPVRKLGHFGSFQIHDAEDFEEVRDGKLMFSIEGQCRREEVG